MSTIEKDYIIKFLILFIATFAGIFAIWYALMREESVDWLSSQISHQVSPYAVTETEDGLIVSNVLMDYGFNLPKGFKIFGSKNFSLFIEEAGEKKCEIKHNIVAADKTKQPASGGNKVIIYARELKLIFELVNTDEQDDCGVYLEEIKNSMVTT